MALTREQQIAALEKDWAENPRWKLVKRGYSAADVVRLGALWQLEVPVALVGVDEEEILLGHGLSFGTCSLAIVRGRTRHVD